LVKTEQDVAEVMRRSRDFALSYGLSAIAAGYLATAATELASNLVIHAKGGTFIATLEGDAIRLMTEDNGPGIDNIALAMSEGYSTAGGLGLGLPGVQRLMDRLEIISPLPSGGTRVIAWKRGVNYE
jgi:serine/threonine-protein kinase RsbT